MNKFTPLPQAYKDEIQLDEALADPEINRRIEAIDLFILLARDIGKNGKVDVAKVFDEFRKKQPLFDNLQRQRDAYDEDLKKRATLTGNITSLDKEIAQYKQKISELLKERKITSKEIDGLDVKFGLMYPHTHYRKAMVECAKEHDTQHAERIEQRAGRVEELISKGDIKEDVDGVSFGGLKTASKTVQEKALQDAFGDKLLPNYGREDHQGNESGTKKVYKKDLDAHGDQFGGWALGSIEQLNKMREWIRQHFDYVKTEKDDLYILQLINPDLFETMWMKDTTGYFRYFLELKRDVYYRNGYFRYFLELKRDVYYRNVNIHYNPDNECGLFLVR